MRPAREIGQPGWHVDWRLPEELPEDKIVRGRFLINTLFTVAALAALLFTSWLAYLDLSLRQQVRDWDRRLDEKRTEIRDLRQMQRDYATEAAKIDEAYTLLRPQLFVSNLIANLGQTRPDSLVIDMIEWNETGVVVRGRVHENSERASRLLGAYVDGLRNDRRIGPLFREILLTDVERAQVGDTLRYEIQLRLPPLRS